MSDRVSSKSRRAFIRRAGMILGGAAALPVLADGRRARAQKMPRAAAKYREHPQDGQTCGDCRFFLPADGGAGACRLVKGEISPNGWCQLFSPKG